MYSSVTLYVKLVLWVHTKDYTLLPILPYPIRIDSFARILIVGMKVFKDVWSLVQTHFN